ncbi:hypothetical protein BTVI_143870 [Pitangus sulphuratus]|nr:hypothetical protein BTVI_143870 [Pitangus sulphuratus]
MPDGSRTDFLLLAKAKPIRTNSNAPVITHIRTEECCTEGIPTRKSGVRTWDNHIDTKVSAEGGGGGTPWEQGKDSELKPLQPMVQTMVKQVVPLEDHGGPSGCREPPAAHGGAHAGAGGCMKETVTPWEAWDGAGSCRRPVAHREGNPCQSRFFLGRSCGRYGGPTLVQLICEGLHPMEEWPTGQHFGKNCCLRGGLMLQRFIKDCLPWEGPHRSRGGFTQQLTATFIPHPPASLRGEEREHERKERSTNESQNRRHKVQPLGEQNSRLKETEEAPEASFSWSAHSKQNWGCCSTPKQPVLLEGRKESGFCHIPRFSAQSPAAAESSHDADIPHTPASAFGCGHIDLVLLLQAGQDGQQSQDLEEVGRNGAQKVWVGGNRGLGVPVTTESPEPICSRPQGQYCALA